MPNGFVRSRQCGAPGSNHPTHLVAATSKHRGLSSLARCRRHANSVHAGRDYHSNTDERQCSAGETACTGRARQCKKIEEICKTLVACGLVALDDQAQALGLCRSTTWTLLRGVHKSSGLSASTVNKILSAPRLPARVRLKVLEYVAEKVAGKYGDRSHRLKAYVRRLDPRHSHLASGIATPA